ncbi:MAG: diguanylate cyclase [Phycisphaerae bacterium]
MSELDPDIQTDRPGEPRPRVLMVDDDPDQLELQSELLREHYPHCGITTAVSCSETLRLDTRSFDVAVFDVNLPDGNGIELMKRVRETRDLPVIILTGERSAESATEAIRNGAVDFVIKHGDYLRIVPIVVEKALALLEIKTTNRRLGQEIALRNAELERLNAKLRDMTTRDSLTGLYNRRHFRELLSRLYSEAQRYNTDLTCMMIDMDSFKRVNDSLGHQTGDRLLELLAAVIRESIRESDVPVRYGGDEFVVLLPRTTPDEARASAKRILGKYRSRAERLLPEFSTATLSIGLASRDHDQPPTAESLVRLADEALYLAKAGGRDRIMVVRPMTVET